MSQEFDDFRQRVLSHAKLVMARAPKIDNEARTNASLVQPFLSMLGYDVTNPDEVSPEHHADFSEKYQNKVDYAILINDVPVIALESKRARAPMKDDRGQLRSYFNACPTVKLGVLTDGIKYELYADSDKPNMMDEAAFLKIDFEEIAKKNSIDDNTLEGLSAIRNGQFNPANVGTEAKRKLLFESIVEIIRKFKSDPPDDYVRFVLGKSPMGEKISKVTQKIVDANREIVKSAMEAFVDQEALAKIGYAPKDVVKTIDLPPVTGSPPAPEPEQSDLPLSKTDMETFSYIKNRLFYLVRNETLFREIQKIETKKGKTSFRIYYVKPNNGSLVDLREHKDGRVILQFPALGGLEFVYAASPELDGHLLKVFTQRVTEAGVSLEGPPGPVLRAIPGGQSADKA